MTEGRNVISWQICFIIMIGFQNCPDFPSIRYFIISHNFCLKADLYGPLPTEKKKSENFYTSVLCDCVNSWREWKPPSCGLCLRQVFNNKEGTMQKIINHSDSLKFFCSIVMQQQMWTDTLWLREWEIKQDRLLRFFFHILQPLFLDNMNHSGEDKLSVQR